MKTCHDCGLKTANGYHCLVPFSNGKIVWRCQECHEGDIRQHGKDQSPAGDIRQYREIGKVRRDVEYPQVIPVE